MEKIIVTAFSRRHGGHHVYLEGSKRGSTLQIFCKKNNTERNREVVFNCKDHTLLYLTFKTFY
jgi:hypothetical protein